jgi:diaminohydroxyphosphoribosylaminopyrimidine deaminase/5-amino-6-(5-phosphoribosylamino)uracil reductase
LHWAKIRLAFAVGADMSISIYYRTLYQHYAVHVARNSSEVIAGITDPNPLVSGNGFRKMEEAGVKVITGVLKEQCTEINRRFIRYYKNKRPYVILKWAQTADGFIDIFRDLSVIPQPSWISNEISRMLVHKRRSEEQAFW